MKGGRVGFDSIPQPEQAGLFPGERRVTIFTYKWRPLLRKRVEESTIRTLETQLSGLEVHGIYVEDSETHLLF